MALDDNGWVKLGFTIFVFFEAIIMGLLPVLSKSFTENPVIIGAANAFSGGVFLAICTMHIMPEQTESWADQTDCEKNKDCIKTKLPLPFALLVGGYTLILVLDRVLFDSHDDVHKDCELQESLNRSNYIENRTKEIRQSMGNNQGFEEQTQ